VKPVIIIAIAFVLLIPISALGQEFENEAIKAQEQFEQEFGTFEELQQEGKDIIKNIPAGKIENQGEGIIKSMPFGGGCLIATATYGSELAPQVQLLRELRDNHLLNTEAGTSFINSFNEFYYSFSPYIADYERENPVFREIVKIAITPMITSLSILNYVDMNSESSVLGYGISLILLNIGMYVGIPAVVIVGTGKYRNEFGMWEKCESCQRADMTLEKVTKDPDADEEGF